MSEPSVYTQFFGMNFGVQGCGSGGKPALLGGRDIADPDKEGMLWSSGSSYVDV